MELGMNENKHKAKDGPRRSKYLSFPNFNPTQEKREGKKNK